MSSSTARSVHIFSDALAAMLKTIAPNNPHRLTAEEALAQFRRDCEGIAETLAHEDPHFDRQGFMAECGLSETDWRLFSSKPQALQVSIQRRAHQWFLSLKQGTSAHESGCLVELTPSDGQRAEAFFGGAHVLKPLVA